MLRRNTSFIEKCLVWWHDLYDMTSNFSKFVRPTTFPHFSTFFWPMVYLRRRPQMVLYALVVCHILLVSLYSIFKWWKQSHLLISYWNFSDVNLYPLFCYYWLFMCYIIFLNIIIITFSRFSMTVCLFFTSVLYWLCMWLLSSLSYL